MASTGPQLPPHLQKRKRTPEDDASPPTKMSRQGNDDEISLEDDSDDGFGPSAPTSKGRSIGPSLPPPSHQAAKDPTPASRSIGPSLPPTAATNNDEIALSSDSDSDVGPAPPRSATDRSMPPPPPNPTKRVLGPAPPPADLSERPTTDPDSDSDSDDGWGPALPSATSNNNNQHSQAPISSRAETNPAVPKRDDWMIAPPTENTSRAPPDPTKLKNRKFAGGPRGGTEKSSGVSSIWTETPEQKLQRLTNAVLGRDDPNAAQSAPAGPSSRSDKRKVDEERIKAFTEQTRGRSLVEEHKAAKAASKAKAGDGGGKWGGEDGEDDPSMRPFDREKDMAVGGKLSNVKKNEMMNRAANFGGRFQKGSYL